MTLLTLHMLDLIYMTNAGDLSTTGTRCSGHEAYYVSTMASVSSSCVLKGNCSCRYPSVVQGVAEKVTARAQVWFWSDTLGLAPLVPDLT